MSEPFIIRQTRFTRNVTLNAVDGTTEEAADRMPDTFNNNIRWHLGHILVSQDQLLFGKLREESGIPPEYAALFGRDTRPADWEKQPPPLKVLRSLLAEQPDRISNRLGNRLDESLPRPFRMAGFLLSTFGEVLSFSLWHEAYHLGFINGMKRALGVKELWKV